MFTEPTACAMHGLETLNLRPGSSALVFGTGPTGLLLAQPIANGGAASVTVAAPTQFKLDRAAALGIDTTVLIDHGEPDATKQNLLDFLMASSATTSSSRRPGRPRRVTSASH